MNRTPRKKAASAVQNRKPMANSLAEWHGLHLPGRPMKIAVDAEVRAFVHELLPQMTFAQIAAACRKKFGPKRAPGKTVLHRYWQTVVRPGLIDLKTGLPPT